MKLKKSTQKKLKKDRIINEDNLLKKSNGITLIALIITIIILLILAGVAINAAIGDNGLFKKSQEAVQKHKDAEEKEAISLALATREIDKNFETGSESTVGTKLWDKTVENGSKWNIVVMNDSTEKPYGTGYTFLEKGSNLEGYGALKNAWIINDETGDIIELEDKTYTNIAFGAGVGTKEGLIFNLDPSIIEGASDIDDIEQKKEYIQEKMGSGVELVNFDWNENSGLTNNSFILDGENDYIKIQYNTQEQRNALINDGITFEFYGIADKGKAYKIATRRRGK